MPISDPVHGTINFDFGGGQKVQNLLESPIMTRLRFLKQNIFATYEFLGADHTRYAHALGTMHVASKILEHLKIRNEGKVGADFDSLKKYFNSAFADINEKDSEVVLISHIVAAALLQDIGELPFHFVLESFYDIDESALKRPMLNAYLKGVNLSKKNKFNIAYIFCDENKALLNEFDCKLLSHLIVGNDLDDQDIKGCLLPWLHILDGEIDADRLDYVYRDAYYTIGQKGSPDRIIETISNYDEYGPIINDPAPVAEFFTTRAHLWNHVYTNPGIRYRVALLREVFNDLWSSWMNKENTMALDILNENKILFSITPKNFNEFHDIAFWGALEKINGLENSGLSDRAGIALKYLIRHESKFNVEWIPNNRSDKSIDSGWDFPDDLFFEVYDVEKEHNLYRPGTVRVINSSLSQIRSGEALPLEDCAGPFSKFLSEKVYGEKMPGCILVFRPVNYVKNIAWEHVSNAKELGVYYKWIMEFNSKQKIGNISSDTSNREDFTGETIFISYCFQNIDVVKRIVSILYQEKRRYLFIHRNTDGVGATPYKNSDDAASKYKSVIVVLSKEYAEKLKNQNGYISAEIAALTPRINQKDVRATFIVLDKRDSFKDALPWMRMGFAQMPVCPEILRNASESEIKNAVKSALNYFDQHEN